MPTVPRYSERQTVDQGLPAAQVSVQTNPDTFGAGWAELGKNVAGLLGDTIQKANVARQQEAMQQFQAFADDQFNNADTGLMTKTGKNAIGQAEPILSNLRSKADELSQKIPEGMRPKFMEQINEMGMAYKRQALRYEIGQTQQYETEQFQATLTNGSKAASTLYGDNHSYIAANKQVFDQIDQYGSAHGWSSEQVQAKKVEFKEATARQTVSNYLGSYASQFLYQNGEPYQIGGAMRVPSTGGGSTGDARGLRNNNPGNIESGSSNWEGQTGSDGRFAKFVTPEHGIRALGKNLMSYGNQGYDTINEIVNRWAPKSDGNDTKSYVDLLTKKLGVKADDKLDLSDINVLKSLTEGIVQKENGSVPYTSEQIDSGVSAALGISTLPSVMKRLTGVAAFDALSADDQARFMRQAESIESQQRSQFRGEFEGVIKDATSAYLRGKEFPNAPGPDDFIKAYGYSDGLKNYQQFRQTQQLGADIGAVQNLSLSSQQSLLLSRLPVPGEGYAAAATRYDSLVQAVEHVNKARQADPVNYAQQQQILSPVSVDNVQQFGSGLAQRANLMPQISQAYGTPLKVFSKEEAAQLGQIFKDAPVSQQVSYLDTMRQSIGDKRIYMAALQQVSESASTAAVAGIIMDKPGAITTQKNMLSSDVNVNPSDAAMAILEGNRARKGEKGTKGMPMPKDTDMRADFASYVGDAFAGDADGAEMAYQTALDYYAGISQRKGDITGEYDASRFKQAMAVSTGGIYDYNGQGNVMLPWGMGETEFDSAVNTAWQDQVIGAGIKAPPGQYGLQSNGDSQYLIKIGAGYLHDNNGHPVVLDLQRKRQRFIGDIPQ